MTASNAVTYLSSLETSARIAASAKDAPELNREDVPAGFARGVAECAAWIEAGIRTVPVGETNQLTWKPIGTWQAPPYSGYTPKVLVGCMWPGPDGRSLVPVAQGIAWYDHHREMWVDSKDGEPWAKSPTLWLCEVTGRPLATVTDGGDDGR